MKETRQSEIASKHAVFTSFITQAISVDVKYCCGRQMAARKFECIIASYSDLVRFWHKMATENVVFVYTVRYIAGVQPMDYCPRPR